MKVYIAKDWRGLHTFITPPRLIECGGMPDIWSGYKLPVNISISLENEIPTGQYIEKDIYIMCNY